MREENTVVVLEDQELGGIEILREAEPSCATGSTVVEALHDVTLSNVNQCQCTDNYCACTS